MAEATAEATAWVLALDRDLWAAVGEHEMVHMVQVPTVFTVPDAPPYCRQVLRWEAEIVPVLDLAAWLHGQAARAEPAMVGIFAYQDLAGTGEIGYGGLPLQVIPARRKVRDEQACALPEQPAGWRRIALACFQDGERPTPILDLSRLFSGALLAEPTV